MNENILLDNRPIPPIVICLNCYLRKIYQSFYLVLSVN